VGQRGVGEAAVAPRRSLADALALEHRDGAAGPRLGGEQRRPQPGEAAADDGEVDLEVALQRRGGRGALGPVEPEAARGRVAQGSQVGLDGRYSPLGNPRSGRRSLGSAQRVVTTLPRV
jgi:hypothetical protein